MGNNLRKLRLAKKWTHQQAADAMNMSRSGFIKIERSERGLSLDHIQTAAKAFNVTEEEVYSAPKTTRLVGYVGAGSEAHFYEDADHTYEEVPMPSNGNENTVAVEIRGDSLGSVFRRYVAYYDDIRTPPDDKMLRELCVVGLPDGRVLIKELIPGSIPGRYHLLSNTEAAIENVEVKWAAVVTALQRRYSR